MMRRVFSTLSSSSSRFDVVVVGGGPTGGSLVISLASQFPHLRVALLDRTWTSSPPPVAPPDVPDMRVLALSPASMNFLSQCGVWDKIARTFPYYDMKVWDAMSAGEISFHSSELNVPMLGSVVENNVLQSAVAQRLQEIMAGKNNLEIISPDELVAVDPALPEPSMLPSLNGFPQKIFSSGFPFFLPDAPAAQHPHITAVLKSGRRIEASLIVGCDGANSALKKLMKTKTIGWDYQQRAVVSTVQLAENTGVMSTCWQRFLPNGPIAILPSIEPYAHIVWSTTPGHAESLCRMDDQTFLNEVRRALMAPIVPSSSSPSSSIPFPFSEALNTIRKYAPPPPPQWSQLFSNFSSQSSFCPPWIEKSVGGRSSFPLRFSQCFPYVHQRCALAGDAAHTMHPLAGQGFNMALHDIASLTQSLGKAVKNGEDVGDAHMLSRYQHECWTRNTAMLAAVDTLQKVFSVSWYPFAMARALGMYGAGTPPIKAVLAKMALGQN